MRKLDARRRASRSVRFDVACLQTEHRATVEATLAGVADLARAATRDPAGPPRLIALPEYFFVPRGHAEGESPRRTVPEAERFVADLSRDLGCAVAGTTLVESGAALNNRGIVYDHGRLVGAQTKIHPMPREAANGIVGGDRLATFEVAGRRAGILVCADVLYPEAARVLALDGAEILLVPVMSPHLEPDPTREAREALFVARAYDAGAFVLKAGGFSRVDPAVAGRSFIAAPWGILARYGDPFEPAIVRATLDFDLLARFRTRSRGLVDRRPEVYADLSRAPARSKEETI